MRFIRPSRTQSTAALRGKSLLNALMFFGIFMVALAWLADRLGPQRILLPFWPRVVAAGLLFSGGLVVWILCADLFGRSGRGTPLPLDAPRHLVTTGPFAVIRNPIGWGNGGALGNRPVPVVSRRPPVRDPLHARRALGRGLRGRAGVAQALRRAVRGPPSPRTTLAAETLLGGQGSVRDALARQS